MSNPIVTMLAAQRLTAGKAFRGGPAPVISRPRTVAVKAAITAQPVAVPVKSTDGATLGEEQLALKVAKPGTAKGLVHRYLVYVQTNGRRVR